ncbi:MAG TPA: CidA/LrgA family protein [Candidatus Deferrimicrobium sp.]|nr:CidA/LrgA family protein [Candidatus Deferrimicrobium sp.]
MYWLRIVLQIAFLWVIYQLGNWGVKLFHLPIPGNVLGMILLFILLLTGVIPVKLLAEGADLLLKHLAFFFIPVAVGLMEWGGLFKTSGIQLLAVILLGAAVCILVTGGISSLLARKAEGDAK